MFVGLLPLARPPIELREPSVAVGDEGAHPEPGRKRHGMTIVIFDRFDVHWGVVRENLAKEAQCPRLVTTLFVPLRQLQ